MGIMPNQVNDLYYIIKGYMDTMYSGGGRVSEVVTEYFFNPNKQEQLIDNINTKFGDTEKVRCVNTIDEIVELITRDFFIVKDVRIEVDIKPS